MYHNWYHIKSSIQTLKWYHLLVGEIAAPVHCSSVNLPSGETAVCAAALQYPHAYNIQRQGFIHAATIQHRVISSVLPITSGHRTISDQLSHVSEQYRTCAEKMSGRKRAAASSLDDSPPSKKRGVTARTVDKWIAENDRALNTTTWLQYDRVDHEYVATLTCSVCIRF